ncbi:MAG: DUF488 domain-containing protein [Acidobacteriia bacterium]|nr:DUF488 domain-containing protein [Terriglobia bacterium]
MSTKIQPTQHRFFTVGYQAYSADSFISDLKVNGIELLIDVRENPFSFKRGFSRSGLTSMCSSAGVGYEHRRELGTPREIRTVYKETGDAALALRRYDKYLKENIHLLDFLVSAIRCQKVCILCLEHDHTTCHRGVIARKVQEIAEWATPVHLTINGSRNERSSLDAPIRNLARSTSKRSALEPLPKMVS